VELGGSVLKRDSPPTIAVVGGDEQLDGVTIRHDVVTAGGNHAHDRVQ
jgi:hypothetical protein